METAKPARDERRHDRWRGIDHVQVAIPVGGEDRARAFYGDLLGLSEIERPDLGIPGAWYRAGSVELHLIQAPAGADVGTRAPKLTPLAGHLALEFVDL